ncbi:MAG: RNA-binding domain-containing protein [Gammaproteobacteria bacterium]
MYYPEIESNTLEFKREIPKNDQIVKTIIAFCNQLGGKLILGIEDNGYIKGLNEKEIVELSESIEKTIFDSCEPHIIPRIYAQVFGSKSVLVIEVSEGMNKPYHLRREDLEHGTYIRLGKHTLQASSDIIQELQWQSRGINFESQPIYKATIDDLDQKQLNLFLEHRKNHAKANIGNEVLQSYNLITQEHSRIYPTVCGILLFGRNPQKYLSEGMIICSHFQGTSGRETIATIDCEGTLFDQFKQAFAFIKERLYHQFTIKSLKRNQKLEIPEIAIREALLNAIVHRNYHITAPSKIAIYDNRVEIFSPGQFPGPININNLLSGITYLRNPSICKILREAEYIEKLGTGFITIFTTYEKEGLKKPQIIEGENFIKYILPRGAIKREATEENDYEKILTLFYKTDEITTQDIMEKLAVSRQTAVRRINAMIEENLIKRIGQKKATRYRKT